MHRCRRALYLILLLVSFTPLLLNAQKSNPVIRFRQGDYLTSNTSLTNIDPASKIYASSSNGNSVHVFIQFRKIPTQIQKESLIGKGIELIEYIPGNTFLASVNTFVSSSDLKTLGVLQVIPVKPNYKIDKVLAGIFEKNSLSGFQTSVLISAFPNSNTEDLVASLKIKGISISPFKDGFKGLFIATVSSLHMNQLLEDPFVYFVESLPEADKSLNMESGILHNSSTFNSAYSGKYLTGKGVIIGIGDDGQLNLHIDNYYKVIENLNFPTDHATHVAGIATGSGNLNPRLKGQAPEAKVIDESFSGILSQTPQYFQNYGMVLTNNSYGSDGRCTNSGAYSSVSRFVDQQLLDYPEVMHVFAAGNTRIATPCLPYPTGYFSIYPSYQSSKNAISVGGSDKFNPSNFYSKGPTNDGRIKPEIVAVGNSVLSTGGNNNYYNNFGTSMAAPQVTGVMALMVERYRQLNAGANPKGALLKTIVCNSSDDIGNAGPDYANGYGWLNAAKAIECIEKKLYATGSIQQDETKTFSIAVSNNIAELKVAAYWPDKPASLYSRITLVNDIDITVTAPDGTVIKPQVLDSVSSSILSLSVQGNDHSNNLEQVTIKNPTAGNYIVTIKGYAIPFGPQDYSFAYSMDAKGLQISYPFKNERWKYGENQLISWRDPGNNPVDGYQIEWSQNGINNWQPVSSTSGITKNISFTVPQQAGIASAIRVTNKTNSQSSIIDSLVIEPEIIVKLSTPCNGKVDIVWPKVIADSFSIYTLKDGFMSIFKSLTDTSYQIDGLNKDSIYWFAVAPWYSGKIGERGLAKSITPANSNCILPQFDGDFMVVQVTNPNSGRKLTSTERSSTETVSVQIKNLDNDSYNGILQLKAFVNGQLFDSLSINSSFNGFETKEFSFLRKLDLSTSGDYSIKIQLIKTGDPDFNNNSVEKWVRIVSNPVLSLPFIEQFNSLKDTSYKFPGYFALLGANGWDYSVNNNTGVLKTRGAGFGNALSISSIQHPTIRSAENSITGTFNLSGISLSDNLLFSYNLNNPSFFGSLSIRGSDTSVWIPMNIILQSGGSFNKRINLTRLFRDNNQKPSNSTQIKIEASTSYTANSTDKLYYDNFEFTVSNNDADFKSLISTTTNYFPKDTIYFKATIINNSIKPLSTIALTVQTPAGVFVRDTILSINTYDTVERMIAIPGKLWGKVGVDTAKAWIDCPGDDYTTNNYSLAAIRVNLVIDSFDYIEGMEKPGFLWGSNFGYVLRNNVSDSKVRKAANGKTYWYFPDPSVFNGELRSGTLASNGLDISKMKNPYLSFSTIQYLRPKRDSARVVISYDNGRTFKNLNTTDNFNWYNNGTQTAWIDSNKLYWHVVTTKLPDSGKIALLRFQSLKIDQLNYPLWAGGMAIDDIHIYDLKAPILQTVATTLSGTLNTITNGWNDIIVNGNLIASIDFNGEDPGKFSWSLVPGNDKPTIVNSRKILNRRWVFVSEKQVRKPASIKLYFPDSEAEVLRKLDTCAACADTLSAYDFGVYRYKGKKASINSLKNDNTIGEYSYTDASQFNLVPYDKGYFALLNEIPEGEFFIDIPERFAIPSIGFEAIPDNKAKAITIKWQCSDENLISSFVLERADGPTAFENNTYTEISTFAASNRLASSYEFIDKDIKADNSYYYRIKILYKNGYKKYTIDWVASTGKGNSEFSIYPNPSSTGLFNITIPQTNGAPFYYQVTDALGRLLQQVQMNPSGSLNTIVVDLSTDRYQAGTYFLKINNGNERKSIRLLKLPQQ